MCACASSVLPNRSAAGVSNVLAEMVLSRSTSKALVFEFVTKAAGAPRYHFGMATNAWECPVAERMAGLSVLWWGNCSRGQPSGRQLGSL